MKKVLVLPFVLSLSPVVISLIFSLVSWKSADATENSPKSFNISASILEAKSVKSEVSDTQEVIPVYDINTLPLAIPAENVQKLENLKNDDLQTKLDAIIRSNSKWSSLSKNKTLNIGIVDMNDPLNPRFAAINPDNMVYAASLPKIAVLLASQDAIENGKFQATAEVKADMRQMIAKSSNSAATRMINRVGLAEIGPIMKKYDLYDVENGGGLWVGKAYGGSSGRIGDPIKNLSHAASVFQVCNYYYKLAFGQLVNPERSKEMLDILVDPELHHKFVSVLDRVAPDAKVYRKSGTWSTWHTDSALVWDANRKYIVVALAEDAGGETMLRELMLKIDAALVAKG